MPNLKAALGTYIIFCFNLSFLQQHSQHTVTAPLGPAEAPPVTLLSGYLQLFCCFKDCVLCIMDKYNQWNFHLFICCWNRVPTMRMVCNSLRDQAKTDLASLCRPQPLQCPKQWPFAASPLQNERAELWCCSYPAPYWRRESHRVNRLCICSKCEGTMIVMAFLGGL